MRSAKNLPGQHGGSPTEPTAEDQRGAEYDDEDGVPAIVWRSMMRAAADPDRSRLRRQQISHDIHHELGTIMLLGSLLTTADDVGPESRHRARLILGEIRWLEQLHLAFEGVADHEASTWPEESAPIRLDKVAAEIVEAMRLSTLTRIRLVAEEVVAHTDRLNFWRALRNVIQNAVRAAGPTGHVDVRIAADDGWAVVHVDDDGPGFGEIQRGRGSLGLGIVQEVVATAGGHFEVSQGFLGGCCVRLQMPAACTRDLLAPTPSS